MVAGFLNETFGMARAWVTTIMGFEANSTPLIKQDLREWLGAHPFGTQALPQGATSGVLVLVCNAPEAMVALSRIKPDSLKRTYRIGYWVYELPQLPKDWITAASLFDELWAPTEFVADMLRPHHPNVRIVPYWTPAASPLSARPAADAPFTVATAGDLRSSETRKNLRGAVQIFTTAFPSPSKAARLRIKVGNSQTDAASLDALVSTIAQRDDIELIDRDLDKAEMAAFIGHSDVYLSAHRAEGYGLVLAEAMRYGVTPLATGYSGNMDFMDDFPELLIDCRLVPVRDPTGIYPEGDGLVWAEPDIADGARKLRTLFEQEELRARLGEQCQRKISQFNQAWTKEAFAQTEWFDLIKPNNR